jgi:hypothetical protein
MEVFSDNTINMGTFGAEALTVSGSDVILPNTTNSTGDFLTIGGNNKIAKRTSAQVLLDINAVPKYNYDFENPNMEWDVELTPIDLNFN